MAAVSFRRTRQLSTSPFPQMSYPEKPFRVHIEWGEGRWVNDPRGIDTAGSVSMSPPEGVSIDEAVKMLREQGFEIVNEYPMPGLS